MQGDGGIARVVVWLVARVQRPVLVGARFVAKQSTDERQIVMRGQILHIESQRLFEPADRFAKQRIAPPIWRALELCALEERLAEFIQRTVILAEVEFARACFGEIRVDHIAEITDRIVELTVLLVNQAGKPGDRPWVGWYLGLCRSLERSCRLVEAPLAQADTRYVKRAVASPELLDLGKCGFGLPQLAASSLTEKADAVVVPALPHVDLRFGTGY